MNRKPLTAEIYNQQWMYDLFHACYHDVARASDILSVEVERDCKTVAARLVKEGTSFFTKTLPKLGKQLDKLLAAEPDELPPDDPFPGFGKGESGSKIPKFLGCLFSEVLTADGKERSDASPEAYGNIRLLTGLFYKTEWPLTPELSEKVITQFLQTEEELPEEGASINQIIDRFNPGDFLSPYVLREARRLCRQVLGGTDPLDYDALIPRHGPGAVATGETGHEKTAFKRYYDRLHSVFPYDILMSYNLSSVSDEWEGWQGLESLDTGTAKVVLVPKDSRGPRLISCEPLEYQWVQQAMLKHLVTTIEKHPLTRGQVNFSSQEINRDMAQRASLGGPEGDAVRLESGDVMFPLPMDYVTLDMKDASDRVSCALVKYLFPENWYEALYACRSAATKLPCGRVVPLKKFAPMGSAVCFPIEALVFWSIARAMLHHCSVEDQKYVVQIEPTPLDLAVQAYRSQRAKVYVYGDDIIVPRYCSGLTIRVLEAVGLKANLDKCCRGRFFRESCGMDAYKGICVTPLRIRTPLTSSLGGTALFSWCSYHNWFERRGMYGAAELVRSWLCRVSPDLLVLNEEEWDPVPVAYLHRADTFGLDTLSGRRLRRRWNSDFQRYEFRGWVARVRPYEANTPGWSEMLVRASASRTSVLPETFFMKADWLHWFEEPVVTAYQYARARRVIRKRAWLPLNKR